MVIKLDNFLHSFAKDVIARAAAATPSLVLAYPAAPSPTSKAAIWRGRAVEKYATDPYTTIRITGGAGTIWDPLPRLSLQFWTVGSTGIEPALNRAQCLFETLLDDVGRPARMRTINGYLVDTTTADGHWLIVSIDPLQRPSHLGVDANGRDQVSFNCDLGFVKKD